MLSLNGRQEGNIVNIDIFNKTHNHFLKYIPWNLNTSAIISIITHFLKYTDRLFYIAGYSLKEF